MGTHSDDRIRAGLAEGRPIASAIQSVGQVFRLRASGEPAFPDRRGIDDAVAGGPRDRPESVDHARYGGASAAAFNRLPFKEDTDVHFWTMPPRPRFVAEPDNGEEYIGSRRVVVGPSSGVPTR